MYKQNYCIPKCRYYSTCHGNIHTCVVRIFHQVLATLLPREEEVVRLRYGLDTEKGYPYTQIANKYKITTDHVKQIEAKSLRKLRHPSRARIIRQTAPTLSANDTSPYAKLYKAIFGAKIIDAEVHDCKIPLPFSRKEIDTESLSDIYIADCDLSIRTINCLAHSGIIETLADLIKFDFESLKKIRNISKFSLIEIYLLLDTLGVRPIDCPKVQYPNIVDFLTNVQMMDRDLISSIERQLEDKSCFYQITDKLYTIFNIETVNELSRLTRQDLQTNAFENSEIEKIVDFLHSYLLELAGEATYTCDDCGEHFVGKWDFTTKHYCTKCLKRQERIRKVSAIKVNLSTYDEVVLTEKGTGVVLHASIFNGTDNIQSISLIDFYLVQKPNRFDDDKSTEYDMQIAATLDHDGYCFSKEIVFPYSTKCCGKIFLYNNDFLFLYNNYVIITLKSGKTNYMFRFDYHENKWDLHDYYELDEE